MRAADPTRRQPRASGPSRPIGHRAAAALALGALAGALAGPAAPAAAQQAPAAPAAGGMTAAAGGMTAATAHALAAAQQRFERGLDLWQDHSTWDSPWVARTAHFEVRTTTSFAVANAVAEDLERFLPYMQQCTYTNHAPAAPYVVFVHATVDEYNTFCNDNGGAEHGSFLGVHNADQHADAPVVLPWEDNLALAMMHARHGVTHRFLAEAYPRQQLPTWLAEALPCFFASGAAWDWTLRTFAEMKSRNALPRLERLLADDITAYGLDTEARKIELSMLVYYLLMCRPDTRTAGIGREVPGPFRDYLLALLEGRPTAGLPCAALLARPADLERDLMDFEFPAPQGR